MSLLNFVNDLRNTALLPTAKHTAFQTFITYFETLKVAVLNNKTFTDKQLSEHIFKTNWNDKQGKIIFEKHLFAAQNTIQRLNGQITVANFNQYEFLLVSLAYDLFGIVAYAEENFLGNTLTYSMGGRPDQDALEIFNVSRMMLVIGTINPPSMYLREVFPVAIFLLRQTIEIHGKRLLGYYSITDEKGQRPRSVSTQIAWDFIKTETLKPNSRIALPLDVDIVMKVEQWTNSYVHTGNIPEIYLIENAIQLISPLLFPRNSTERNYKGSIRFSGTSKIKNYNSLKTDFELYVNQFRGENGLRKIWNFILTKIRMKKKPSNLVVNWKSETNVDATITSL